MAKETDLAGFLKKQAATDGIAGGAINGVIHYLIIGPVLLLPVTNWENFNPSLFGFLIPLAIMLSFIQSYISFWITVAKRRKGAVTPTLAPDINWKKVAVKLSGIHAGAAAIIVVPVALVLSFLAPSMTIDSFVAVIVIGISAGILAWICSSRAVNHTQVLDA
jgi:hypothetical protein